MNIGIGVCIYAVTFFVLLQTKAVRPSNLPETVWVTALVALLIFAIIGVLTLLCTAAIRRCVKRP